MSTKIYVPSSPDISEDCAKELIKAREEKDRATALKSQPKAIGSILSREIRDVKIIAKHRALTEVELNRLAIIARIVGVLATAQKNLNPESDLDVESLSTEELEKLNK